MMLNARTAFAVLMVTAITASAELPLLGPQPIRLAEHLELPLPAEAVSAKDREDGKVSLFITVQNDRGCAWTLHTAQPPYLAAGTNRFPLSRLPAGPHFGALAAGQPLALDFPVTREASSPLRLVLPSGIYSYSAPAGEFRLEAWKGLRLRPKGSVDPMNRMFTVDASDVSSAARAYRFARPGRAPVVSDRPVWRGRLDDRTPFDVHVTAVLTNGEELAGTARIAPHEKTTPAPLPDGEILVGLCFYKHADPDESFYVDAFLKERLGNLAVFWPGSETFRPRIPEYTRALAAQGIYSMTIYQNESAQEVARRAQDASGRFFLNNNIGEFASYLYQGLREAEACKIPQRGDLQACREHFTDRYMAEGAAAYHRNYPYIFSTCGASIANYELEGGVDFMSAELYAIGAQNLAWATSEMRGAARKWQPEFWSGWLAHEWQTGQIPYASEQKFQLLRASLYQQYLMGTRIIVLESGADATQAGLYTAGAGQRNFGYADETPRRYRSEMKRFYDFVRTTPRAKGTPETHIALAMGNNDLYVGLYNEGFVPWAQHKAAGTNANWRYGAPERTWLAAQETLTPLPPGALAPYPNLWLAGSPFGQIDVVGVDSHTRLGDISRYKLLAYTGWNTMTGDILDLLNQYVRAGGTLFIGLPHVSTRRDREYRNYAVGDLIGKGDLSTLIAVSVSAKAGASGTLQGAADFLPEGLALTNEPAARVTLGSVVKTEVAASDGTPLLVSQKVGAGQVYLLLTWEYPGKPSLCSLYKKALRTLAGRVEQRVTLAPGPDAESISYAVYADALCLLNVDCRTNRVAGITAQGRTERIPLRPGEFKILPIPKN